MQAYKNATSSFLLTFRVNKMFYIIYFYFDIVIEFTLLEMGIAMRIYDEGKGKQVLRRLSYSRVHFQRLFAGIEP